MRIKERTYKELQEAFIKYLYFLEMPLVSQFKTEEEILTHFLTDRVFNNKVRSLTGGVMHILDKHLPAHAWDEEKEKGEA